MFICNFSVSKKTSVSFVLQPPSSSTAKETSAEAAAYYLKDKIFYGDYVLTDNNGAPMDIDTEGFVITEMDKFPGQTMITFNYSVTLPEMCLNMFSPARTLRFITCYCWFCYWFYIFYCYYHCRCSGGG